MTTEELKTVIELHQKWIKKEVGGTRAYMSGAYMSRANLSDANLRSADLSGADLRSANLSDADLRGAKYSKNGVEAKRFTLINNLYKYCVIVILGIDGSEWIFLGCKSHTRQEWESNFWNNVNEFPDDGSEKTESRKLALATACAWLDMVKKQENTK